MPFAAERSLLGPVNQLIRWLAVNLDVVVELQCPHTQHYATDLGVALQAVGPARVDPGLLARTTRRTGVADREGLALALRQEQRIVLLSIPPIGVSGPAGLFLHEHPCLESACAR